MSVISGIMGAGAAEDAADTAAAATREGTAAQERIYQQMRDDFEPYRQIGLGALPYLQSAVLGGPVATLEQGYSALTSGELDTINQQSLATNNPQALAPRVDYRTGGSMGVPTTYGFGEFVANAPNQIDVNGKPIANPTVKYDPSKTWYRGPDGTITDQPQMQQISWTPGESPAAKYQLEKGNTALQRALAARGLAGSGYSASKAADLSKSVAADDWNNQYNRILDLTKIGTGASASTGSAANTLSSAYGQQGSNLANIASDLGQTRASLYSGASSNALNAANTGVKAYNAYQSYQTNKEYSDLLKAFGG